MIRIRPLFLMKFSLNLTELKCTEVYIQLFFKLRLSTFCMENTWKAKLSFPHEACLLEANYNNWIMTDWLKIYYHDAHAYKFLLLKYTIPQNFNLHCDPPPNLPSQTPH